MFGNLQSDCVSVELNLLLNLTQDQITEFNVYKNKETLKLSLSP